MTRKSLLLLLAGAGAGASLVLVAWIASIAWQAPKSWVMRGVEPTHFP